ncbi:MAG: bile acid CoA ligase [Marmoricola sp.]|nr:bile acid CoA ligase [Marmoricola sp.]
MSLRHRITRLWWIVTTLVRSGMLAPLRPDKYLRMADVVRRQGTNATTGLSLAAARRPRGTALVDERGSLTWAELERRCNALAVGLAAEAGRPPGTIGILCRNHRGFVEALSATARLGADALLLNTGFSAPQLADVLEREGAEVIVYDEEFAGLLGPVRERLDGLVEVVAWTDDAPPGRSVESLIAHHLGEAPPKPSRHGRTVLLTSGTTGAPKGARRAGGGADQLAAMLDRIPWRAEETVVVAAPMFHAWGFGQLAVASTMTCTIVMRRRFDPEATLELVQRHRATGLSVVPVMLERIIDLPDDVLSRYDTSSLRFVTASGSRMRPEALVRFMDRFGDVVHNSYNATEAGQISVAVPADLRVAPDTAGRAVRGTDLRIVDDEWHELPAGEVGRIIVRSDSQFEGYTHGGSKDFHEDYMVSGDVGRLDADGRLFVVGRDDEMIVSGGENVYPLEIEETLGAHDAVREAAVFGVDDEQFGQRLVAFVVLSDGASASPDDLKAHVRSQLAGYKVPREVTVLDELPRNASGKVVKRELLEDRG